MRKDLEDRPLYYYMKEEKEYVTPNINIAIKYRSEYTDIYQVVGKDGEKQLLTINTD